VSTNEPVHLAVAEFAGTEVSLDGGEEIAGGKLDVVHGAAEPVIEFQCDLPANREIIQVGKNRKNAALTIDLIGILGG
jgi:hypothetical protein